ncbi:GntR family transcriptional regulator [Amycolatopsis sp. NPDC059657]|uniref:GntR family transcriptional regulator n=1 Tax=Amycolatopsis sp. NPDC059657 TaxID=3346899 RepID=UPI00366D6897
MSPEKTWASVSLPYVSGEPGDMWALEAAQQGHRGTHKILGVDEDAPPEEVRQMLRLEPGETAVVRRRLVLLDDQPIEFADSYYPMSIARGTRLADPRKIPGGAAAYLATLGYQGDRVVEDVDARIADAHERATLRLPEPSCVLVHHRVIYAGDGQPVEASIMTKVAPGHRIRYTLSL